MTERPILFSGDMVRAILAGRKTQTRRVVGQLGRSGKWPLVPLQFDACFDDPMEWGWKGAEDGVDAPLGSWLIWCPYGVAGDRLWVRENGWQRPERTERDMREGADTWRPYYYDADGEDGEQLKAWGFKRRPSIHMPRRFCRLVLELTNVRVERLRSITRKDAAAEGICWCAEQQPLPSYILPTAWPEQNYLHLWDHINGRGHSAANPWVWVVEFRRTNG